MAEQRTDELNHLPALDAWEGLEPDPEAMEQVITVMMIGVQTEQQPMAASEAEQAESRAWGSEAHRFRLIAATWALVGLAGYLGWSFAGSWLHDHPQWSILAAVTVAGLLLIPLLLLPLQNAADANRRGGASA